jgi:hypothetical protein
MKGFTILVLAPALAFSLTASAQQQAAPESPSTGIGVESVIVTAPALRSEKVLNRFVITHTAPSPWLGKIARWKTGVCPLTVGLPDRFNLFITQRIIRVAMMAGAPLDAHEPCRPNTVVLVTDQPQALLDFVSAKRPALLGFHYRPQRQRIATMTLPVQAWYSTATEDFYGLVEVDMPSGDLGYGVMSSSGAPQGMHVSGSRIGDGLKSQFATAIIIVDRRTLAGQEVGPLADYIAMLALSQGQSYGVCQEIPTITNLLAPDCSADMKPSGLTDIDLTYLRGLYKMDAGASFYGERGSIAFEMKKELGGY